MKNQVKKSPVNNFRTFFGRLKKMTDLKRRNQQNRQVETLRIMDRISQIRNRHPELAVYLNAIPEFPPSADDSEIKLADLRRYRNNLLELLEKYELESDKHILFI